MGYRDHDNPTHSYADLDGMAQHGSSVERVATALDAVCAPSPSPRAAHLDAAMARILRARTASLVRAPYTPARPRLRLARLAPLAAALALALTGVAGYLRWQDPTPVSAQTILRHAAAVLAAAGPDQATHDVFAVHTYWAPDVATGGLTAADLAPDTTYDSWVQRDVGGAIVHENIKATGPGGALLMQVVQDGPTLSVYDAKTGATQVMTQSPTAEPSDPIMPDPVNPDSVRQYLLAAQQGMNGGVHLLPQRTLDGATVDVIQVDRMLAEDLRGMGVKEPYTYTGTLYVDAQTYTVRELDVAVADAVGNREAALNLHSTLHEIVPLSDVPAQVFSPRPLRTPVQPRL